MVLLKTWPIADLSQMFQLPWLRRKIPEFGRLPAKDQCHVLFGVWPRALAQRVPLVVLFVLVVPSTTIWYLIRDASLLVQSVNIALGLFIGWLYLVAINREIRRAIPMQIAKRQSLATRETVKEQPPEKLPPRGFDQWS